MSPNFLVIAISLVALLFLVLFFLLNKDAANYEKLMSAENITRVNVITKTGDVSISAYEGDEIHAYLTGKNGDHLSKHYKLTVKEKGNEVTIKAKKKTKYAPGFIISVELPSKLYEQLQVHADVANIDIDAINVASYELKTSVGNINVDAAQGIINAGAQVGNIHLQLQTITSDIAAKTEVGNIVVETKEAPEALQTECKTTIGTTTINLPNVQDGAIGIGGPLVKLLTDVGDVSLLLASE